jgi:hypothetical protein
LDIFTFGFVGGGFCSFGGQRGGIKLRGRIRDKVYDLDKAAGPLI